MSVAFHWFEASVAEPCVGTPVTLCFTLAGRRVVAPGLVDDWWVAPGGIHVRAHCLHDGVMVRATGRWGAAGPPVVTADR